MVAYTKRQQRKKESERLRGERDQNKFIIDAVEDYSNLTVEYLQQIVHTLMSQTANELYVANIPNQDDIMEQTLTHHPILLYSFSYDYVILFTKAGH